MTSSDLLEMEESVGITRKTRTTRAAPVAAPAIIIAMFGIVTPTAANPSAAMKVAASRGQTPDFRLVREPRVTRSPGMSAGDEETRATKVLDEALSFAEIVSRALPFDEEMDLLAERALRRSSMGQVPRKLIAK